MSALTTSNECADDAKKDTGVFRDGVERSIVGILNEYGYNAYKIAVNTGEGRTTCKGDMSSSRVKLILSVIRESQGYCLTVQSTVSHYNSELPPIVWKKVASVYSHMSKEEFNKLAAEIYKEAGKQFERAERALLVRQSEVDDTVP